MHGDAPSSHTIITHCLIFAIRGEPYGVFGISGGPLMPQGAKGAFPERGPGRANECARGASPERGATAPKLFRTLVARSATPE